MDIKAILGEELFKQVQDKLAGQELQIGKIPVDRFNEINTKKNELQDKLTSYIAQIETLQTRIEKLQEQIKTSNVDSKVLEVLTEYGAKKPETVKKLLDLSAFDGSEDSLKSLKSAVEKMKQDEPYLFSGNRAEGNIPNTSNSGNDSTLTKEDFAKMTYDEKVALYNRDKALYDSLKGAD